MCEPARRGGRCSVPVQLGERGEVLQIAEQQADLDRPRDRLGSELLGLEDGVLSQLVVDPAPMDPHEQRVGERQQLVT
jgi:hypothetical protein